VYGPTDVRWRTVDVSGARVELLEVGTGVTLKMAHLRPDLIRSVTAVNPVGGAPDRRGLRKVSWLGWSLASSGAALPKSRPHAIDARQLAATGMPVLYVWLTSSRQSVVIGPGTSLP
jgi:pimeloyl-ACP methyl ester carboxylesterase